MPSKTPRKHLDEDLKRVEALHAKARILEDRGEPARLVQDVRLSSVALAVGAMDAYLFDQVGDQALLTAVHPARNREEQYLKRVEIGSHWRILPARNSLL